MSIEICQLRCQQLLTSIPSSIESKKHDAGKLPSEKYSKDKKAHQALVTAKVAMLTGSSGHVDTKSRFLAAYDERTSHRPDTYKFYIRS